MAERVRIDPNSITKDGDTYLVPSQREPGRVYRVTPVSCTCKDFEIRGGFCKHREAVEDICPPVGDAVIPLRSKYIGDPFEGLG